MSTCTATGASIATLRCEEEVGKWLPLSCCHGEPALLHRCGSSPDWAAATYCHFLLLTTAHDTTRTILRCGAHTVHHARSHSLSRRHTPELAASGERAGVQRATGSHKV